MCRDQMNVIRINEFSTLRTYSFALERWGAEG